MQYLLASMATTVNAPGFADEHFSPQALSFETTFVLTLTSTKAVCKLSA